MEPYGDISQEFDIACGWRPEDSGVVDILANFGPVAIHRPF
jgi:hypothetical protein